MQIKKIDFWVLHKFYLDFEGEKTFLQDAFYGEFRAKLGEEVFLYGFYVANELIGVVLIQKIKTRFKTFLHVPHGPLFLENTSLKKEVILSEFLDFYKKLGVSENCDFVRISPLLSKDNALFFKEKDFVSAPIHLVNPEKTWILDITLPEADILAQMKKSTRYEVNKSQKGLLKIQVGNGKSDLDIFWELHEATVARHSFVPFTLSSTQKELKVYGDNAQIFSAKDLEGKFLSSSIILFDNQAAYYHQGASVYSKLPASHATLWAAILEAKKRGCTEFNFWGVSDSLDTKHPWYGLSKFKRGFGGVERNYLHVQDYGITYKYKINCLIERWRKFRRGY